MPECDFDDNVTRDDNFEFVPKNWLMSWLSGAAVGPIETKNYLCVHENMDIDRLGDMKICDKDGVNLLYDEFGQGEGPRLNSVNHLFYRVLFLKLKFEITHVFILHFP